MKRFILTYHTPASVLEEVKDPSPEEIEAGMKVWYEWAEKCGENLLELGNPCVGGKVLDAQGNLKDSKRGLSGYSILQAKSIEEALTYLEDHPHLSWNDQCEIELHELTDLPQ